MALYGHVLVVGGTGMLASATRALAGRAEVLTAVARTTRSQRALADNVADAGCVLHEVALDWSDPDAFVSGLNQHIERTGPPSVVLAWLHDDHLASRIAQCVALHPGHRAPSSMCEAVPQPPRPPMSCPTTLRSRRTSPTKRSSSDSASRARSRAGSPTTRYRVACWLRSTLRVRVRLSVRSRRGIGAHSLHQVGMVFHDLDATTDSP